MVKRPNWIKIRQALQENFLAPDFNDYSTTTFSKVSFDKVPEIFRYIIELKTSEYDESTSILTKLEFYADGTINKEILKELITGYEPFIKKLYEIVNGSTVKLQNAQKTTLGSCYNKLFKKLGIGRAEKNKFFDSNNQGEPVHSSASFSNFLTDSTKFGKDLHASYYLRNSKIHNDAPIIQRDLTHNINFIINSYFYFIFNYYQELLENIDAVNLEIPHEITIKNLASLSGGAVNFEINNEVKRKNIIQTIESKLSDLDMIFIEGEEGIGKTTILHQFISNHSDNCFS